MDKGPKEALIQVMEIICQEKKGKKDISSSRACSQIKPIGLGMKIEC